MLTFIFCFVIALVAYSLISRKSNKKHVDLLPGPTKWPIIGNVIELGLADSKYPHLALTKLAKKYGDVYRVKLGVHEACVVTSYEALKEIGCSDEAQGRYTFPFVTDRAFNKTLGIIWSNGEMWNCLRRFTMKSLKDFGFGKLKSMDSTILEEASDMIGYLKSKIKENDGILDINPHDYAGSIVNILWSMVAGYKFPIADKTVHQILDHGRNVNESTSQNNIYNVFPELRYWFPKMTKWDKHMNTHLEYQKFVKEMIEKATEQRANRDKNEPQNFIEVFLDEIDKNLGDPNTYFTEQQLIVILQDLFLAGSETTGTAMTWALLYLANNPRVQTKLQEEIKRVIPSGKPAGLSDFKKMPYMRATLNEIFRISAIAPIPPPRLLLEDLSYKGYTIPKGSLLLMCTHDILNDKSYWRDPEVFRPERFLDESGTNVVNTERVVIFGCGKRVCMGENLVWDAMSMYLTLILSNFNLEVILGKEPTPKDPHSAGTLNPQPFSLKMKVLN